MGISVPIWLQEPLTAVTTTSNKPKVTNANNGNDATATSLDGSGTDTLSSTAISTTADMTSDQQSSTTSSSMITTSTSSEKISTQHSTRNSTTSSITASSTTTSSTRSSKSSIETSSTASATPTNSLSDAICRERDEFPDHGAVQPDWVRTKSANFCVANLKTTMQAYSESVRDQSDEDGVSYDYKIEWIDGCTSEHSGNEQSVHYQTGLLDDDEDCYSLIDKAFACTNGGIGGHVGVGCLRYSSTGGEFTAQEDPPASDDSEPEPPLDLESDSEPTPEVLRLDNLQCHSLDDFHKVNDVHSGFMRKLAADACSNVQVLNMYSRKPVFTQWYIEDASEFVVKKRANCLYTYEWIPNCIGGEQTTLDPAGKGDQEAFEKLFAKTYDECTGNEGIGGSIDVGCLRYTFHGGLDHGTTAELDARGGSVNGIAIGK